MFLINFTLYNPEVADSQEANFAAGTPTTEECWPGEQARRSAAR
jgi:hypothetical protein